MKNLDLRKQFPLLSDFAKAYLHQDIELDFGTPNKAASAFLETLSAEDRTDLAEEAEEMRETARKWTLPEVNRAWDQLGSSWIFNSVQELDSLLHVLGASKRRPS